MPRTISNDQYINLTYSYLALRKAVGWIGISLPFVLLFGNMLIFKVYTSPSSVSLFYHTGMGDVLVGALCSVALFLFFYSGYDKWDNWLGNIAAIFAIGTALFPTSANGTMDAITIVHIVSAALFFVCLAIFSLFRFTRNDSDPSPNKITRNQIYIVCGIIMLSCLLGIMIFKLFFKGSQSHFNFWAESIALIAFGISWLTKGGTLYPDKK